MTKKSSGYTLPQNPYTNKYKCVKVYVPVDSVGFYQAALIGSLHFLTTWVAWQKGGRRAKVAGQVWLKAYLMTLEGLENGCDMCDCEQIENRLERIEQLILSLKTGELNMCNKSCCCQQVDPCQTLEEDELPEQDTGGQLPPDLCDASTWIASEYLKFIVALQRVAGEGLFTLAKVKMIADSIPLVKYLASTAIWLMASMGVNVLAVLTNVRTLVQDNLPEIICAMVGSTSDSMARTAVNAVISSKSDYSFVTRLSAKIIWLMVKLTPLFGDLAVPAEYQGSNCNCGGGEENEEPTPAGGDYLFWPMEGGVNETPVEQYVTSAVNISGNYVNVTGSSTHSAFFNPKIVFDSMIDLQPPDIGEGDVVVGYMYQSISALASTPPVNFFNWLPENGFGGGVDFSVKSGDTCFVFFTLVTQAHREWFESNYSPMGDTNYQSLAGKDVVDIPGDAGLSSTHFFQKQLGQSGGSGGSVSFSGRLWWIIYKA